MGSRWVGLAGVAGLVGVVVGGCSGGGSEAAAPVTTVTVATSTATSAPAVDAKAVAWMDGFCGAVHGYRQAVNEDAKKRPQSEVATTKTIGDGLGRYAEFAGKTVDELTAIGVSPVPAGETARKSFVDKFTAARDAAAGGKAKLDAAKRGDAKALDAGIEAMNATQNAVKDAFDPVSAIMGSPELSMASATATKCRPVS